MAFEVSLDEAREMALTNWREAKEGRDPIVGEAHGQGER